MKRTELNNWKGGKHEHIDSVVQKGNSYKFIRESLFSGSANGITEKEINKAEYETLLKKYDSDLAEEIVYR